MSLALATNDRTATRARIKRGSAQARRQMRQLDAATQRQIDELYQQAAEDIRQRILAYAGSDGSVRLEVMQQLLGQVEARLQQLSLARDDFLDSALNQAAGYGVNPYTGSMDDAFLTRVADEAVNFVQKFVENDGLQLSDRIWRLDNGARERLSTAIQTSVIQGHSASSSATEFLNNGQKLPPGLASKMGMANADRIAKLTGAELLRNDGNARAHALGVFRTEINRAHGEAYMLGAEEAEGFGGHKFLLSPRHPKVDICDMHASVNRYGLGPGVYPDRQRTPWPAHPKTLSFVEIVFIDEITDEDKEGKEDRIAWLKKQAPAVQEGVLNSRKKRAALQRDILTEREITTPWNRLKKKYQRKGIDVDALQPMPVADFRDVPLSDIQQEAVQYVTEKGIETGFEHAVVYDLKTRTEYIRKTSRRKHSVSFDKYELNIFYDSRRKLEVVHNHPGSSSLSGPDLKMATAPGVSRIVAVGHDGTYYGASVLDADALRDLLDITESRVLAKLVDAARSGKVNSTQAQRIGAHITNRVLHRLGVIDYTMANDRGAFRQATQAAGEDFIETVVDEVVKELE